MTMDERLADLKARIDSPKNGRFGRREGWELYMWYMSLRNQIELQAALAERARMKEFKRHAADFPYDIRERAV